MKEYTVSGPTGEYTVQLSDEDAEKLGAKPVEAKKKPAPANKAAAPSNKRAEAESKAFGNKSKADG